MELNDTIELMQSTDYKDRFKAEYHQLCIRREKLVDLLDRWNRSALEFQPNCPFDLLDTTFQVFSGLENQK